MSENTQKKGVSGPVLSRPVIFAMLRENFEKLPEIDQKFCTYGPAYLAGNGALAGLVANSLYRRALNVRQARFASSLPMAVLPFISTYGLYNAIVSVPLMSGDLNCPSCALMRGALVGALGAGLYPIILALPVNLGLASMYSTAPLPEKGAMFRFWVDLSRPILNKMRVVLVLQAFFGTYLASRDFKTYTKLVEITFGSVKEELTD
ncbi:transmembrane protein 126A [Centropristis striata]|uniref:transmembrane protein 126A n=1 Tax=Centropristis striata TaxID=184440 RepID=UPI0027E129DB|nr:transmembrane protein 126A [Centropristis striata]